MSGEKWNTDNVFIYLFIYSTTLYPYKMIFKTGRIPDIAKAIVIG